MAATASERWNRIVNVAILITLGVVLLAPSGLLGRWVTAAYGAWDERRRVERTWDELVSAPSVLSSGMEADRRLIVEFVDYDCAVCQAVAADVAEATHSQGVSVVVRHVPSDWNGPGAGEAALAAICAERYGAFAEAHEALLSDPKWLQTQDWVGFGASLGITPPTSFDSCMREETTRNRLARDRELADYLRIPGTPTFVSSTQLHPGATGLRLAVAAASSAPVGEVQAPVLSPEGSVFDSSENPNLSEVGVIVAGLFLPDSGIALVDRNEVHLIDVGSGEARVVGRKGEGPREFGHIEFAKRTPRGILIWDFLRRRAVVMTDDGELVRSAGFGHVPLKDFFNAYPVGVDTDGRFVFRDGDYRELGKQEGRVWNPATYVVVRDDGALEVVAAASGDEMYHSPSRSDAVVYGNRTFEAATADHLIVADTRRGGIAVLDWSGGEVVDVPMPAGLPLNADQVQAGREARIAELERIVEGMKSRAAASGQELDVSLDQFHESPELRDWPANEVAPPIDEVLTDSDARLWVRDYRLPGQDSVTWRVWDIGEAELLFRVRMAGEDKLLDARGDLVLLRRTDQFDVPRAVISPLAPVIH